MYIYADEKNTLHLIIIKLRLLCCVKPMSNYIEYNKNNIIIIVIIIIIIIIISSNSSNNSWPT